MKPQTTHNRGLLLDVDSQIHIIVQSALVNHLARDAAAGGTSQIAMQTKNDKIEGFPVNEEGGRILRGGAFVSAPLGQNNVLKQLISILVCEPVQTPQLGRIFWDFRS